MPEQTYEERVGYRIRRKREIVGKQQQEIAEAIGMHRAQYSRLEKGDYLSIRFDQLRKLADVLLTSADYLLWRSDDMGEIPPEFCPAEAISLASDAPLPTAILIDGDS